MQVRELLMAGAVGALIRDAVSKGAMKIAGYNRSRMESDKPNPFLKGIHLPLPSETMLEEIGRASCRERV